MSAIAFQTTILGSVYSTVYSGTDQRKHQSTALLAFVRGIHQWSVYSPHKGPETRKMFLLDDVIMQFSSFLHPTGRALCTFQTTSSVEFSNLQRHWEPNTRWIVSMLTKISVHLALISPNSKHKNNISILSRPNKILRWHLINLML